jgi:cyclase
VVAAIDVKVVNGQQKIFVKGGKEETQLDGFEWCKLVGELGAGEILLTSMDKDGTKDGYDLDFLKKVVSEVSIPVIASGGAGTKEHFLDAFTFADVDACLAASLFHFQELDITELKKYLQQNNVLVRL